MVQLTPEVAAARSRRSAIVALESSVFAQGLPVPANAEAARRMVAAVRAAGAVPAVTAVVRGSPTLGLTPEELERFLARDGVAKASARDLPAAAANGADAATTVAGALVICRVAGVPVLATGGIGGVHREPEFDESADLLELARTPAIVVCSGAKSILDLPATVERLESLSVLVIGYRTSQFPGFYFAESGLPASAAAPDVDFIVACYRRHLSLELPGAILVVQPPPAAFALPRDIVERAVAAGLEEAREAGVRGAAVTPFLLAAVERHTEGASLAANLSLLEANAGLAGEIAVTLARAGKV